MSRHMPSVRSQSVRSRGGVHTPVVWGNKAALSYNPGGSSQTLVTQDGQQMKENKQAVRIHKGKEVENAAVVGVGS